ncbi:MAG: ATP-binding protein [Actinomycetales bacterium]|nr:ATP-binding protein [Actinomycetales bacterium]
MTEHVHLSFPAQTENVALARTLAAAIAARADLPVDQLEDFRLAVSEVVTGAIVDAGSGAPIACAFSEDDDGVGLVVTYPAPAVPDAEGFGWAMIRALLSNVEAGQDDGIVSIRARLERRQPVRA